jgi:hypothetical protein
MRPVQLPSVRAELDARFPFAAEVPVRLYEPGTMALGRSADGPVAIGTRPRLEHAHIIGTTGGGKTNLLEHLIRQDIKNGDGICVIDPHGNHPDSLYRSLITWLFGRGYNKNRTIHLIDPNATSHTTGFNPLALPDAQTSVSVVAGTALEAFERVWGGENTHGKPTIRRILKATFAALAELQLTLSEGILLFDHRDVHGVRALAIEKLTDRYARAVLADLDQLAQSDRTGLRFRDEVVGPMNRLAEFVSASAIRRIIGQRENVIDLRAAMDEGHIILVNLSGGDAVNDADTELLGRLLTRFLFFHAKRRKTSKPFWFYLDECQRYLSGDVPNLLAEARKFRVGVTLSHQWQSQLSKDDEEILAAVHNATNLKVAFRIKHPKEAKEIAEAIIPLDLEAPVKTLIKPTVVGSRRAWFDNWSKAEHETYSTAVSQSVSHSETDTEGDSESDLAGESSGWSVSNATTASQTSVYDGASFGPVQPVQRSYGVSGARTDGTTGGRNAARTSGTSRSHSVGTTTSETVTEGYSHGHSESHGASEGLEPVFQDLPSAVHGYQNALYFAAQALRSLAAGDAYASFVDDTGMHTGRVHVPRVKQISVADDTFTRIRTLLFAKSPSATETPEATLRLERREQTLLTQAAQVIEAPKEPDTPKDFRAPAPKRSGRR